MNKSLKIGLILDNLYVSKYVVDLIRWSKSNSGIEISHYLVPKNQNPNTTPQFPCTTIHPSPPLGLSLVYSSTVVSTGAIAAMAAAYPPTAATAATAACMSMPPGVAAAAT